jgi:hypothetical protein
MRAWLPQLPVPGEVEKSPLRPDFSTFDLLSFFFPVNQSGFAPQADKRIERNGTSGIDSDRFLISYAGDLYRTVYTFLLVYSLPQKHLAQHGAYICWNVGQAPVIDSVHRCDDGFLAFRI